MKTNSKNTALSIELKLFGNTRVLVLASLLAAMSIVLGKFLQIPIGDSIRISFENLPLMMGGIFFGPFVGASVGIVADIIGCIMKGYAINPIITLGAASIGFVAGYVSHFVLKDRKFFSIVGAVLAAHAVGSMLIKSVGLRLAFNTAMKVLLLRVPLYVGIGILEAYIVYLLLRNKAFSAQLERTCRR